MIRITGIKLPLDYKDTDLFKEACRFLKINESKIKSINLAKRSVDARKKHDIRFVISIDVKLSSDISENEIIKNYSGNAAQIVEKSAYTLPNINRKSKLKPIVIGAGPAGLFAAYTLALSGLNPIVIERGQKVDDRVQTVNKFWSKGILDTNSNVQFGEGGAGTFSDGKLNTGIKNSLILHVLNTFHECGAPAEILWQQKPHIGTDKLRDVVKNMRERIESLGGEFRFESQMDKINIINNKIVWIDIVSKDKDYTIDCDSVVLAIGHSARDTFHSLYSSGVPVAAKSFAVGVRIEHSQEFINKSQYGAFHNHSALGAADYKLAVHLNNGRGVYSFCMCPGGYVVAAASEENRIAVNGMSNFARDGKNANSAILVNAEPSDFNSDHPLAGIEFQRKIEQKAFHAAGGGYKAPVQSINEFLKIKNIGQYKIEPTYTPGTTECNLRGIFPKFITDSLTEGLMLMNSKIPGFVTSGAVLTAPETRSSSPVRILRNEDLQSDIIGLYPCGEGAGYAGGITSAAVDGIRCAEAIISNI